MGGSLKWLALGAGIESVAGFRSTGDQRDRHNIGLVLCGRRLLL
jgi:hypothetical protein